MKIRKAIIPAAGLGTRVLPASKSCPKEMLPIVDKPAIQYIVEEAVKAAKKIGYPVILRPAFTLGGSGGGIATNSKDMTTVTLRVKDRKRKRSYLYLDYYPPYMDPVTRVTKRQEYLGLFIYTPPANSMQKEYNKKILERAETIRNKRAISVVNQEAGIFDSEVISAFETD